MGDLWLDKWDILLGPELKWTWCQDELFRLLELAPCRGHALPLQSTLKGPSSPMALWVPGILCLGDSLFVERQRVAFSEFMFYKKKLLSMSKKRI